MSYHTWFDSAAERILCMLHIVFKLISSSLATVSFVSEIY